MQSYCTIIGYIPYGVHYIPMTYLFYTWKFVPLDPFFILPKTPFQKRVPLATRTLYL